MQEAGPQWPSMTLAFRERPGRAAARRLQEQAFIGHIGVVSFARGTDALQCVLTTGEG